MAQRMPAPFVPYRSPWMATPRPIRPQLRGYFGSVNLAPGGQSVSPQQGAEKGAAAGASFGPWGAVIGAAVGTVVGLLSAKPNTAAHIGTWDTQLVNQFAALPPAAGVGREFQWNYDSQGLVQMLEALLATGVYMNWDTSILSNYDVCANWAVTLSNAAQVVATAVCKNAKGAKVTVSITAQPGGPVGPAPFTFTNPGILVGPEAVSDQVIMGASGVMTWLFSRWTIAGTAALSKQYAAQMGNNAAAAKVYALMVDYVAGQLNVADAPAPITTDVAGAAAAGATAAKTVTTTPAAPVSPAPAPIPVAPITVTPLPAPACPKQTLSATPAPIVVPATPTTPATPITTVSSTDAQSCPTAALTAVLQELEANGADTSQPAVQAAATQAVQTAAAGNSGAFGNLSTTDILIGVALLAGVYFIARK